MNDTEKVAAVQDLLRELHLDLEQLYARYGRERPRLAAALAERLDQFAGDVRAVIEESA
jgi:hypothetical protein